ENGIKNILSFYESGKLRFQQILTQDVYKTEPRVATGCCAQNVVNYTHTQLENMEKYKSIQALTVQQNTSASETSHSKQIRHVTTDAEKMILIQLFRFEDLPPKTQSQKCCCNSKLFFQAGWLKESNSIGEITVPTPTRELKK
ncbi:13497_t:CDS:1, partial [Ambispora gerdemannii]